MAMAERGGELERVGGACGGGEAAGGAQQEPPPYAARSNRSAIHILTSA